MFSKQKINLLLTSIKSQFCISKNSILSNFDFNANCFHQAYLNPTSMENQYSLKYHLAAMKYLCFVDTSAAASPQHLYT